MSRVAKIEGLIYCLDHGAVHNDDTTDPYDEGTDCRREEHRLVYWLVRQGDDPE